MKDIVKKKYAAVDENMKIIDIFNSKYTALASRPGIERDHFCKIEIIDIGLVNNTEYNKWIKENEKSLYNEYMCINITNFKEFCSKKYKQYKLENSRELKNISK